MGKSTRTTTEPEVTGTPAPEETEEVSTEVVNDSRGATLEVDDGDTVEEAIAGSVGGSDQYPYLDQTRTPLHERQQPMDSIVEIGQAESNPAFTAKAEDGGPVNPETGEGIGTEPNADEKLLAAAQNLENQGANGAGAVEAAQEQIDAGTEAQIDAEAVQADFEAANPDKDPVTGQPQNG